MLELKNICFEIDNKKILDNINITLNNEIFYCLTGPNGSGKSTLAKIIMGIEKPTSGNILLNGKDITSMPINERFNNGISFAFQQPVCFKGITVYDLLTIAKHKELTRHEACDILSKVGLCALEYIDREVNSTLSGGEIKRIEIATIIASSPKIAIFDEPEAGMDLWSFNSLIKVFKELQTNSQGITLVISHQEKILNIAEEIIIMQEGSIIKCNKTDKIFSSLFKKSKCCKRGVMNE